MPIRSSSRGCRPAASPDQSVHPLWIIGGILLALLALALVLGVLWVVVTYYKWVVGIGVMLAMGWIRSLFD